MEVEGVPVAGGELAEPPEVEPEPETETESFMPPAQWPGTPQTK